jgi:hypothetical protein
MEGVKERAQGGNAGLAFHRRWLVPPLGWECRRAGVGVDGGVCRCFYFLFYLFMVLGLELRAYTLSHSTSLFL